MSDKLWPYVAKISNLSWDDRNTRSMIVDWCNEHIGAPSRDHGRSGHGDWDIQISWKNPSSLTSGFDMDLLVYTRKAEHHMLVTTRWC